MIEKIKEILDKYPWLLMVVPIILVAIVGFFFLSKRTVPSTLSKINGTPVSNTEVPTSQSSQASNAATTQSSGFNIFSFILRLFGFNSTNTTTNTTTSNTSAASSSTQSGNSTGSTTTSNGSSNSQTTGSGNTQQTNSSNPQPSQSSPSGGGSAPIQIIFKTPDGGTEVYTPPETPPVDVTWARYVNSEDRYSIDYPSNWQVIKTTYNGHEGVSIYLPGTDPNDPNVQYIGFGLANYYLLPGQNSQQSTYSYPISVGTTNGTMYTQGVLGNGSMAGVFQYEQGSFGLGSNVSNSDFIYVYNHMLQSLTFGPQ